MAEEYDKLLAYYRRMFGMIDAFHFNSQNTAEVYGRFLYIPQSSRVIPITHGGIKDHRRRRVYKDDLLRLGFIGSEDVFKGLPVLKQTINKLNKEGYEDKIRLCVYGGKEGSDAIKNVYFKGRFTAANAESVYDSLDLLVVPSICYETFSFVTLEALSYGTAVLVSDRVGAKDIVSKYNSQFVYGDQDSLYILLKQVIDDRNLLSLYNERIVCLPWDFDILEHSKDIVDFYKSIE